jgi:8-amino-7-oxononanoate synthase
MGGFVASSRFIRDYLVNRSRSLVFSTALPHSSLAHDLAAVRWIRANPHAGAMVLDKAALLREKVKTAGFDVIPGATQIIPCVVGSETRVLSLKSALGEAGMAAAAIRPPTVAAGTCRIRFSAHRALTDDQIDRLAKVLTGWKARNG